MADIDDEDEEWEAVVADARAEFLGEDFEEDDDDEEERVPVARPEFFDEDFYDEEEEEDDDDDLGLDSGDHSLRPVTYDA